MHLSNLTYVFGYILKPNVNFGDQNPKKHSFSYFWEKNLPRKINLCCDSIGTTFIMRKLCPLQLVQCN
jgi:hypothetical protein